ncbi:MAG: preprotein translocase subunit SecE [Planctomycetota bacterium]
MGYKKDQGRYARMAAFWGLFFLLAYGCVRRDGLVQVLRSWIGSLGGPELNRAWIDPFPLLGRLDLATMSALGVLGLGGFLIYRWLSRPKVADMLIDTETELRKVTWPTFSDTWQGTLAVVVTVTFLLLYLTGADLAITFVMQKVMGAG